MKTVIKKSFAIWIVSLLIVLTVLPAKNPDVFLSTSAITPRIGMVEQNEQTHWRTLVGYRQTFGKLFVNTLSEYGTENDYLRNSLRLHTFNFGIHLGKHTLKLGRIQHWDALIQNRIDGIEFNVSSKRFGTFHILSGLKSSTDFSDTSIVKIDDEKTDFKSDELLENLNIYGSWSKRTPKYGVSLYNWIEGLDDDAQMSFGTGFSTKIFGVNLNNTLAWNLTDSQLSYLRFRAGYQLGTHRLALNFRQKRYMYRTWAWMNEPTTIAPVLAMDVYSPITGKLSTWNQIGIRFTSEKTIYLKSTLKYGITQLSLIYGFIGETSMFGTMIGLQNKLKGLLSYGGSLSINALDYGDIAELQNAIGLYGWIGWSPVELISLRLFGRMAINPYYEMDGRGGVSIHATL